MFWSLKPKKWWIRKKSFHRLGAFFEGPKARFASLRAFSKKCQCALLMTFYEFVKKCIWNLFLLKIIIEYLSCQKWKSSLYIFNLYIAIFDKWHNSAKDKCFNLFKISPIIKAKTFRLNPFYSNPKTTVFESKNLILKNRKILYRQDKKLYFFIIKTP